MRVLGLIPARGGSKRLPGKNTRELLGLPLIAWTIDFACSVSWFDELQVSTESPDIAEVARRHGVDVPRLRPQALATDQASSLDVALDMLDWLRSQGREFDVLALLQPTTPVRLARRWDEARAHLLDPECEGAIGVSVAATHPYLAFRSSVDGYLQNWVPEASQATRSQDFPPAYQVNGSLYVVRTRALERQRSFFPSRCRAVVCTEPVENLDIDTPLDWQNAERVIGDWKDTP